MTRHRQENGRLLAATDKGPSAARSILLVSGPDSGLINPMLVLAGELTRRGTTEVWFAADESRREEVETAPATFASLGEPLPGLSPTEWDDGVYRTVTRAPGFRARRALVRQVYRPALELAKLQRLEAVIDKVQPTLMIIDCFHVNAITLATMRRIPFVLSVSLMPSYALATGRPFGQSYVPPRFPAPGSGLPYDMDLVQRLRNRFFKLQGLAVFVSPAMGKALREEAVVARALGQTRASLGDGLRKAEMILCYGISELDYPLKVPPQVRLVGTMVPPLPQAPPSELTRWLDAHPSVVYIGLGTITRLTRAEVSSVVEAAHRLAGAHHVLWKLPAGQQQLLPAPQSLPGNLRVESWVPSQFDVLAHPNVRAFLSHGGNNGFHEGLYFGKPQVIRPLWADCYDQAVRGQDFGVSLTLDPSRMTDPGAVTGLVTRVLDDPSFRRRAEHFGGLLRAAGGRETAADLVLGSPVWA